MILKENNQKLTLKLPIADLQSVPITIANFQLIQYK